MPILLSCRILLLLTMVPFVAVVGRPIPAAPPLTASATPTPQVEFSIQESEIGGDTWKHGQHYQVYLSPPPSSRKLFRGNVKPVDDSIYGHRLLVGSAPPSCQGKCGACVPCAPIHLSVGSSPAHAGSVTQQEYYPEVWRCKCGNKIFMP